MDGIWHLLNDMNVFLWDEQGIARTEGRSKYFKAVTIYIRDIKTLNSYFIRNYAN